MPTAQCAFVLRQQGLREAAEFFQDIQLVSRRSLADGNFLERLKPHLAAERLSQSKGMKPIIMIAALERVPPPAIDVQARASGDQELEFVLKRIVLPLDEPLPAFELVDLVEDDELGAPRPAGVHELPALPRVVPVEVGGLLEVRPYQCFCQGRLADLARPTDKHHLLFEVRDDRGGQVAVLEHGTRYYNICLKANIYVLFFA